MRYIKFSVYCERCGHSNLPARSPREGIRKVLFDGWNTCRGCGAEFKEIHVPRRPLVLEALAVTKVDPPEWVKLFDYNAKHNRPPKAMGRA